MHAVSSRGFVLETLSSLSILMVDLSRMAEELIIWSSAEFELVELADEYCATSSIMPQKKNPVVAETVRAKCGSVIGETTAALSIAKALPNSYNLDLQEITPHLWRGLDDAASSVSMMSGMFRTLKFNEGKLSQTFEEVEGGGGGRGRGRGRGGRGDMSTATELANELVRTQHLPFRQAHQIVGELVRISLQKKFGLQQATEDFLGPVSTRIAGRAIKIDKHRIRTVLDALKTLELIHSVGGANPKFIQQQVVHDEKEIEKIGIWIGEKAHKLDESRLGIDNEVRSYLKREVRS
jgi:argininosuccinate lyase